MLTCIWPQHVWPSGNSTSWPSRRSSRDRRLADLREQRVVEAGDEQGDPHRVRPLPTRRARRAAARTARMSWVAADQRPQRLEVAGRAPRRAGLDEHVAERGRLDRTGEHRQPAGVGGQLAEQLVAGAAADEVDDVDVAAGQAGRVADGPGDRPRRGCRGCSGPVAARVAGGAEPAAPAGVRDPGRHVARRQERRVVGVDDRAAGRQRRRPRRAAPPGRSGCPARSQVRSDSWSSHRPMTLRRKRIRPSTPPSLVKFASRLASVSDRRVELDADQRPGAAGDVGERASPAGRHADDRRRRVVRPDGDHRRPGREPGLRARPRSRQRPERRRRARRSGGEEPRRSRPSASIRSGVPRPARRTSSSPVVEAFVRLGAGLAGQPVAEQVRDQQHRAGRRRAPACRAPRPAGRAC